MILPVIIAEEGREQTKQKTVHMTISQVRGENEI
jgi:hypothetical protein